MRIDKLLSQLKYGSRNDIKKMISKGQIKVNHTIIHDPTYEVKPHDDHICVNDDIIFYKDPIHLAIYKPVGYLSAHHDTLHPCVMDLIKPPYHRFDFKIAGRLDLDAEGLMILTTDGMLAHELTHPKHHVKKTYQVLLDQPFTHETELLQGVIIHDAHQNPFTAKAIEIHSQDKYVKITIDEGKFHQVKRMFKSVGYEVIQLKRIKIGKLHIEDLIPGMYKDIKKEDIL